MGTFFLYKEAMPGLYGKITDGISTPAFPLGVPDEELISI